MKFTYHDILNFEAEFGDDFVSDEGPGGDFFLNHKPFRESVIKEIFGKQNDVIADIDDLFIEAEEHFPEDDIIEIINKAFVTAIDEYGLEDDVHKMMEYSL